MSAGSRRAEREADEASSRPLRVTTIGFSRRARTTIEMFFDARREARCQVVESIADAEIGIIDLDGTDAASLYADCCRQFAGPLIALSVREPTHQEVIWVAKPARPAQLLEAVERARSHHQENRPAELRLLDCTATQDKAGEADFAATGELREVRCEVRDDLQLRDPVRAAGMACTERRRHPSYGNLGEEDYASQQRRHRCFYDPQDYFQGALKAAIASAKQRGMALRVILDGVSRGLTIFPDTRQVQCDVREQLLRNICMIPGGSDAIRTEFLPVAELGAADRESPEPRLQFEDSLLWKVALWSSFGRIPVGTNPEQAVELAYWPNFTRIFIPHHAMQIAALWSQRPVSLLETAAILEIEYRYVFSFYSAAHAISAVAPASADSAVATQVKGRGNGGLFRRLLGYLGASN